MTILIDVDFRAEPRYVGGDVDSEQPTRGFEEQRFGESYRDFETTLPKLLSRAEILEIAQELEATGGGMDKLAPRIYDQKRTVSCTSNAMAKATEVIEALEGGLDWIVEKSAMSLYCRVGGPSSGSSVDDNIRELCARGILPLDTPANRARFKHVMRNVPHSGVERPPAGWEETGRLFRGHEFFAIRSLEGFATAISIGVPVLYGRDGHAILGCRWVVQNGVLRLKYFNSWRQDWGDGGFGYDSEAKVRRAAYGYALRSMRGRGLATAA